MSPDDWDDPLDENHIRLEARFRELEQEAEIEQLRHSMGRQRKAPQGEARDPAPEGQDPLAAMKNAMDDPAPAERATDAPAPSVDTQDAPASSEGALIVICPGCKAKNRVSMAKVRQLTPICGQCKVDLVVLS